LPLKEKQQDSAKGMLATQGNCLKGNSHLKEALKSNHHLEPLKYR